MVNMDSGETDTLEISKMDSIKTEATRRSSMSSSRDSSCSREEVSIKRRSMGTRRETRNKEPEEETKESKDNRAIRTRLSTGSIHMNGTTTIAVAKEIENNSKLLTKDSPSGIRKKRLSAIESQVVGTPPPKKRKIGRNDGTGEDNRNDYFCWLCHKEGTVVCCELCPRVYHTRCLDLDTDLPKEWVCPECEQIMRAECVDTRSQAMSIISVDTLCSLLGFALERMKHQGTEPFLSPVDQSSVEHYSDYIFNPMDLTMLEKNIKKKMYGCTEAFLADAKWILHNCIIFNGTHHKLTASAKMIIKICKHEMAEIELCPDCYWNSCVRKNDEWFTELCRTPHSLAWAKLKGYPFWPAKVLRDVDGQVDVRFFGAHDRSLLPTSQVFLLSKNIPTPAKSKKGGFEYSMEELELHIKKLEQKYGKYEYAPFRCPYDSKNVYKEGKFKVSPKRRLNKNSSLKFGPSGARSNFKDSLMKQRPKPSLSSDSKLSEKQTIVSKTASAVKNKYNSIITTRRNSSLSSSVENSPVKGDKNSIILKISSVKEDTKSTSDSFSSPVDAKSASDILFKLKTRLQSKAANLNETIDEESKHQSDEMAVKPDKSLESKGDNLEKKEESVDNSDNVDLSSSKAKSRTEDKLSVVDKIENKLQQIKADGNRQETNNKSGENVEKNEIDSEGKNSQSQTEMDKKKTDQIEIKKIIDKIDSPVAEVTEDSFNVEEKIAKIDSPVAEKNVVVEEKLTPSKRDYLSKLQETIKKGKENLGITDEADDLDEEMSSDGEEETEDEDGEDEDETDDEEDDDESEEDVKMKDNVDSIVDSKKDICGSGQKTLSVKTDVHGSGPKVESEKTDVHGSGPKVVSEKTDVHGSGPKNKTKDSEGEYEVVMNDVLNEATGEITKVKEKVQLKPAEPETSLMMEVDTESDTDKLVIDTDEDRRLSPSPIKSKSLSPKQKDQSLKTSMMECAPTSPKQISLPPKSTDQCSLSQTELRSDFFQNAVEKTLQQKPLYNIVPKSSQSDITSVSSSIANKVKPVNSTSLTTNTNVQSLVTPSGNTSVKSRTSTVDSSVNKTSNSDLSALKNSQVKSSTEESNSSLIANFTQKIMGPIQSAFSDFFTEILEKEKEKITQELVKTKEKIVEEKSTEKVSDEQNEAEKKKHWEYTQQFAELKYNFRLTCLEMKSSWESEKGRLIDEIKEMMRKEKETAINETKKKQWCAKCGKEAIFYCCWNTSYCDYPCQQAHWPTHMATCMQQTNENDQNKTQSAPAQNNQPSNQIISINRPNGPVPQTKTAAELEQEEFQRRQQAQRAEEHQQFNLQPNGGFMPMHTSPPGVIHNIHRQQESPTNQRKKTNGWSDQDMTNAVAAVNYGGMSINKASKVYNVPRNKITERVSKSNPPMNQQMLPGNQQMLPGNQQQNPQLQLQYVQQPQPMSIPPGSQPFTSPPQMRMPNSQPILTSMINNQPIMSQNNSNLFPVQLRPVPPTMNIPPSMIQQAGQLIMSQGGQPPRQSPNMMPRSMPFHGRF